MRSIGSPSRLLSARRPRSLRPGTGTFVMAILVPVLGFYPNGEGWEDRVKLFGDGSLPQREIRWVPLHTERSIDHIVDYLGASAALPPDDDFILPVADPNFDAFLEEAREWLRQVMRDANVTF